MILSFTKLQEHTMSIQTPPKPAMMHFILYSDLQLLTLPLNREGARID